MAVTHLHFFIVLSHAGDSWSSFCRSLLGPGDPVAHAFDAGKGAYVWRFAVHLVFNYLKSILVVVRVRMSVQRDEYLLPFCVGFGERHPVFDVCHSVLSSLVRQLLVVFRVSTLGMKKSCLKSGGSLHTIKVPKVKCTMYCQHLRILADLSGLYRLNLSLIDMLVASGGGSKCDDSVSCLSSCQLKTSTQNVPRGKASLVPSCWRIWVLCRAWSS